MLKIDGVIISGISSVVPENRVSNFNLADIYGEQEVNKLISSIGVNERRVSSDNMTSSDLCYEAARNLLDKVDINKDDIQAVIFVSQTSEYQLPATACVLQYKLDLPKSCLAFDVNMGCSGYVYGLQIASSLVASGLNHVLLLVGDTVSKIIKPEDRSTELLFGDAGTATLVSQNKSSKLIFDLGSDGEGYQHIIARKPIGCLNSNSHRANHYSYLEMNGGEVFSFTLKVVPKLINGFLDELGLESSAVDSCFYHQANHFMLKHLSKKSKFKLEQVPVSIDRYGNTSCASIPLTICSEPRDSYVNTLLVGFGVGLSWGAVFADLSETLILPVSEL